MFSSTNVEDGKYLFANWLMEYILMAMGIPALEPSGIMEQCGALSENEA